MDTVTISVEEYNKLRDVNIAFKALKESDNVGYSVGWYPRGGCSKYVYIINETDAITDLIKENKHLQAEAQKSLSALEKIQKAYDNAEGRLLAVRMLSKYGFAFNKGKIIKKMVDATFFGDKTS